MATSPFIQVLERETAVLQAKFPELADALSRAHAIMDQRAHLNSCHA